MEEAMKDKLRVLFSKSQCPGAEDLGNIHLGPVTPVGKRI